MADQPLPLPLVGRWAETLPLHGGPVLDLFRIPLPDLPWRRAAWQRGALALHAGLITEAGWSSDVWIRDWEPHRDQPAPHLRTLGELKLLGQTDLPRGWRLHFDIQGALNVETWFVDFHDYDPPAQRSLVELKGRGAVRFSRPGGIALGASVDLLRRRSYADLEGRLSLDTVDARLHGELPMGSWAKMGWSYQGVVYLDERLPKGSDHGPLLAATHTLRLEPMARMAPRIWFGVLAEAGRVDFAHVVAKSYWPSLVDGYFLRVLVVGEGRPLAWLSYRFGLGYGALILPDEEHREAPPVTQHASVAHAGVLFRLAPMTHLRLGYWRDFLPLGVTADTLRTARAYTYQAWIAASNHLQVTDSVHLGLDSLLWRWLMVRVTFAWRGYRSQIGSLALLGRESRLSLSNPMLKIPYPMHSLLTQLDLDVFVTPWLSLGAGYTFQNQMPSYVFPVSPRPDSDLLSTGYLHHRAVGRVSVRF